MRSKTFLSVNDTLLWTLNPFTTIIPFCLELLAGEKKGCMVHCWSCLSDSSLGLILVSLRAVVASSFAATKSIYGFFLQAGLFSLTSPFDYSFLQTVIMLICIFLKILSCCTPKAFQLMLSLLIIRCIVSCPFCLAQLSRRRK